jgi:hypothetical protein
MAKTIVDRSEIESMSVSRVTAAVDAEAGRLAKGDIHAGDLTITVAGYDTDRRELWQIPEVRQWFATWHQRQPYAPYFLDGHSALLYVVTQTGAELVQANFGDLPQRGFRPTPSPECGRLNQEISAGFDAVQQKFAESAMKGKNPGDFAAFMAATLPFTAFGLARKVILDGIFPAVSLANKPESSVARATPSSSMVSAAGHSATADPDTDKKWWQFWK